MPRPTGARADFGPVVRRPDRRDAVCRDVGPIAPLPSFARFANLVPPRETTRGFPMTLGVGDGTPPLGRAVTIAARSKVAPAASFGVSVWSVICGLENDHERRVKWSVAAPFSADALGDDAGAVRLLYRHSVVYSFATWQYGAGAGPLSPPTMGAGTNDSRER